jgi:hypothetical protein
MTETDRQDFENEDRKELAPSEQTQDSQERAAQPTDDDEAFEEESDETKDGDQEVNETDETEKTAS